MQRTMDWQLQTPFPPTTTALTAALWNSSSGRTRLRTFSLPMNAHTAMMCCQNSCFSCQSLR